MNRQTKEKRKKQARRNTIFMNGVEMPAGNKKTSLTWRNFDEFEKAIYTYGYYRLKLIQGNGYNDTYYVNSLECSRKVLKDMMELCNKEGINYRFNKRDIRYYDKFPAIKYINIDVCFFIK